MRFVQTIRFSTTRIDDVQALSRDYQQQQGESARGLADVRMLRDRGRDNAYMVVATFESYEQAMENSARPETDTFARKLAALVDGELGYDNYDVIEEYSG